MAIMSETQPQPEDQPRKMCETCRQALAGLRDSEIVWRPTADLIAMGYPVDNPTAEFTGVRVGDYRAYFDQQDNDE
jgi:hypothetical protein